MVTSFVDKLFTKQKTIICIGALTLWRLYLAATLQLHPDEAYYWLWSRNLDLSYFDHPPMVGYFIWLTTLVSQSEIFVRLSGIIVSVLLSILAWKLAMQLFKSEKIASCSVIIINFTPLTMTGSILITPDTPAFLFWGLSIYLAWQIVSTQKAYFWYLLGVSFGLALLSKYTTVLLAGCLFLFFAATDERRWFKTIHPYLAPLISSIVFLPVIYWNSTHEWLSFKFQFGHGLSAAGKHIDYLANMLEYLGGQLMVVSPFMWLVGIWVVVSYLNKEKEKLFLSLTSLPVIAFFGLASLKKAGEANWPALAYFTFSIALSSYLLNGQKWRKVFLVFSMGFCLFLSMLMTVHARFSVLPLAKLNKDWAQADATNWFYGWKDLIAEIKKNTEAKFVITPSHQLSAQIAYYCRGSLYVYIDEKVTRFSQYNLWKFPEELYGQNGLYIYVRDGVKGPYEQYFSDTSSYSATTLRNNFPLRTYEIVAGKDYLGPG